MKEKIQKAVEEYTDKHFLNDAESMVSKPWPEAKELYKKMLADFATKVLSEALVSPWVSVEEVEPPIGKLILCRNLVDATLAYYDGEDIREAHDNGIIVRMPFWMPIPILPLKGWWRMTTKEIRELAVEYANETASVRHTTAFVADEAEAVISWLLCTHCIVEKSKVMEEYQRAKDMNQDGIDLKTPVLCAFGSSKKVLLESLFPDLGKEMER